MSAQGVYRHSDTQVVVKHFKLSQKDSLEPGQVLKPGALRIFHMRSLFRRKIIGKLDSPWANSMLERVTKPEAKEAKKPDPKPKKPVSNTKKDKGIG